MPLQADGTWTRGASNTNDRGSAATRRARKFWLIDTFGWPDPVDPYQGLACCYRCGVPLTFADITVDRIVPGCQGGRYIQDNIRPACGPCNVETGLALLHGYVA